MVLFKTRLTHHYVIFVSQAELDFAIPLLDEDRPFSCLVKACYADNLHTSLRLLGVSLFQSWSHT